MEAAANKNINIIHKRPSTTELMRSLPVFSDIDASPRSNSFNIRRIEVIANDNVEPLMVSPPIERVSTSTTSVDIYHLLYFKLNVSRLN